ncbi:unnamed protein product [Gongylonema pulchrum]|uniref:Transposase n=1 Tax=Gongylonema pulchrum TaxID=637853 RepID=A0A183ENP9_9BILA|nr:unnamed protein product [Gongylonema pulchrum]
MIISPHQRTACMTDFNTGNRPMHALRQQPVEAVLNTLPDEETCCFLRYYPCLLQNYSANVSISVLQFTHTKRKTSRRRGLSVLSSGARCAHLEWSAH